MLKQQVNTPLVTVICICYNHENFVIEALTSVLCQTYSAIELIVADDASTDNSVSVIQDFIKKYPEIKFVFFSKNQGNCKVFNNALKRATGKYIIDLAADDVLLPQRIEKQVNKFENLDKKYGVIFTDAYYIDTKGKIIGQHYRRDKKGHLINTIPQGDIYKSLIAASFICTPTMIIKKSVLDELGGYDEALSYEDYDFWVRSSRNYKYYYMDELLTLKRVVKGSHSEGFYTKRDSKHLASTLIVCQKALQLNQNQEENTALARFIRYHLRLSLYTQNFELVFSFADLLKKIDRLNFIDNLCLMLTKLKIPLYPFYKFYFRWRYRFHK